MGHLEKMQDLREVIAMLLNINMELCKKVEFLLDDIDAKQEEIGLWQETVKERDDEIIRLQKINQELSNKFQELSDKFEKISADVQCLKKSNDQLDRKIFDEASKICKKTDEVVELIGTCRFKKETQKVSVLQEEKMLEKSKNGQQTEDSLSGMSQEKLKENVQSESPSLNESEEQWESGKADLVGSDDILDKELIENQKNESNTSSNGQMMFN